jgi:hypothetical protein
MEKQNDSPLLTGEPSCSFINIVLHPNNGTMSFNLAGIQPTLVTKEKNYKNNVFLNPNKKV